MARLRLRNDSPAPAIEEETWEPQPPLEDPTEIIGFREPGPVMSRQEYSEELTKAIQACISPRDIAESLQSCLSATVQVKIRDPDADESGKRGQFVTVVMPDFRTRLTASQTLIQELVGRAKERPDDKPKDTGSPLETFETLMQSKSGVRTLAEIILPKLLESEEGRAFLDKAIETATT